MLYIDNPLTEAQTVRFAVWGFKYAIEELAEEPSTYTLIPLYSLEYVVGTRSWSNVQKGHGYRNVVYYGAEGSIRDTGDVFHGFQSLGGEVKWADDDPSRSLRYYAKRLKPRRATQIVAKLSHPFDRDGIRVVDALTYFG